jgi:cell division protein FtsI/penicillin-binding protein 2
MNLSAKINKILGIFLLAFLVITLKVWHLSVVQREEKLLEAQKPRARTILVKADRGIICDRFGIPLALNKICYNATIYYSQIAQIPSISWKTDSNGKQIKIYARKEYIRNLADSLAKTLSLDAERLEALIHSKAALFPHVPFVVKAGLLEEEYYRLRMMEKDWPGLHAEIGSSRFYPMGKTACHILGTMGAISQKEYIKIAQEISELQMASQFDEPFDANRLAELKEKAYAMTDLIGKTGVEARFEEILRGFFGKKTFEVDQK